MLDLQKTVRAAWLSGKGCTAEEIAAEIQHGDVDEIRRTLGVFGANLSNKSFGIRPVSVLLTKKQHTALERAAAARGFLGAFKHEPIVERLMRVLTSDPGLIDNVLDDNVSTPT